MLTIVKLYHQIGTARALIRGSTCTRLLDRLSNYTTKDHAHRSSKLEGAQSSKELKARRVSKLEGSQSSKELIARNNKARFRFTAIHDFLSGTSSSLIDNISGDKFFSTKKVTSDESVAASTCSQHYKTFTSQCLRVCK